ncbi:MAG: adenylyl-sulfate kinase [Pseudomonadota bacterium]
MLIDGDTIRNLFGVGLGFHEEARQEQIRRIQRLASWLADQQMKVIVAALYAHPDFLDWNRKNLPGYFEIYVDAPLSFLQARDSKARTPWSSGCWAGLASRSGASLSIRLSFFWPAAAG